MKQFRNLSIPYFVWCIVFVLLPFLLIGIYAFATGGNTVLIWNFTLENFTRIFEPTYIRVFIRSLEIGFATTAICFAAGYPLAYIISKCRDEVQDMLILIVTIPTWINMLLRTYAWMNILSDNGIVNGFLGFLGFEPISMMYTNFSVLVGMVCNFMPFMIIPIHTSLRKMDNSLVEAAMDLGADPVQTFLRITFRLSMPGVVNGIIMVFLMAISSFVIPQLLGGGQYVLIGNLIESQFVTVGDWNFGSAISLILAVVMLLGMRFMKKLDKSGGEE